MSPLASTLPPGPALAAAFACLLLALGAVAWARQRRQARVSAAALGAGSLLCAAALWVWPAPPAGAAALLLGAAGLAWLLGGRHARWRNRAEALHAQVLDARHEAQQAAAHAAQEAAQALRRQAQQADEAAQAQTRFLAAASHELRSPVHALSLQIEALRACSLDEAPRHTLERMAHTVAVLQAMAATLLDVSRLESGAALPRWDVLPLAPLLRRLADDAARQAESRGLRVALHLADAEAATITDALLLERVLRNLLDNAVKYTQQGGVLLALRRRRLPAGDGPGSAEAPGEHLRVEVWDTGPGIASADHERVFQHFEQAPVHGNPRGMERAPGLGLGLALVRSLVQQLQLRLVMHSRPGRGTVFFVEGLPVAAALPRRVAAARHGPGMARAPGALP